MVTCELPYDLTVPPPKDRFLLGAAWFRRYRLV